MDEIEDSYEIIMKVLCNEADKEAVIQSIKHWYYGHHIGMSDLKIYTEAQPCQK